MVDVASRIKRLLRQMRSGMTSDGDVQAQIAELRAMVTDLDNHLSEIGDRFCPLCERSVIQFAPAGVHRRRNVKCPYCDSWERHRLMWLYLQEKRLLDGNVKVLHFAPEESLRIQFERRRPSIDYVTADLSREDVDTKTDIQNLTFDDGMFDLIICSHVLEHIPDDCRAIAELHRVLRQGGTAIVMVPIRGNFASVPTYEDPTIIDPKERERKFGQFDHVRWYGNDFVSRLEKPGFVVTQIDYLARFSPRERRLYALPSHDFIFRCDKGT